MKAISCDLAKIKDSPFWLLKGEGSGRSDHHRLLENL